MAQTNFDSLVNVLASSKELFWRENANFSESEVQRLWQLRWDCLGSRVGGTSEKNGSTSSTKRPMPRTFSAAGPRPSKRLELVGPSCPDAPIFGLTGQPEPKSLLLCT